MYLTDIPHDNRTYVPHYNEVVFLSKPVMDLCRIEIGSPCLLATINVISVKLAYPIEDLTVPYQDLASVYLAKHGKYHFYLFIKFNIRN